MAFNQKSRELIDFLRTRLNENLPGKSSHLKMAPLIGKKPFRRFVSKGRHKNSSVMLLLFPDEFSEINLFFTLRSDKLTTHKGQISFPGGASEPGETAIQTAFRETYEEIGVSEDKIEFIGYLSQLFVPPSNSLIQPIVCFCEEKPTLKLNPDEVSELFALPIETFFKSELLVREKWNIEGWLVDVPFWNVHLTPLWGATAMILQEFLDLIEESNAFAVMLKKEE